MLQANIEIINKAGLHARAASKLVTLTSSFSSTIKIGQEKMVDGKSILSLMMLAATQGTVLQLEVEGSDEEQAMQAIKSLITDRFDESE
ncbi:MAG TPA: HPr family phosphocarrier protein [Gammaproteobacteria bacterium]|nr:HPr family phosphocarrier protein [Gammaproteobacteria bacterium]